MRALKGFVCWMYALQAAIFAFFAVAVFGAGKQMQHAHVSPKIALGTQILVACFACVNAGVFGMAWWTMWKGKASARFWVIVPSLAFLAIGGLSLFRHPPHVGACLVLVLLGLAGPVVTWRRSAVTLPAQQPILPKVAGDGTSNLLNKGGQLFAVVAYVVAWEGCGYWAWQNHLPRLYSGILIVFGAGFLTTLVHELGHTMVGLAVDMKLRAFVAGPFEFRKREGRWKFKFNLAGILTDGGATGVVPTTARHPRGHLLAMIAAGPLINLYSGAIALGFAYAFSMPNSPNRGMAYPCALFGLYGIIGFAVNLIPLRSGSNYSDGAKIFQLLSNGPWADLHRAVSFVTSSLVTPLEPRDYDIELIQRAARGIQEGTMAVLLRLWAYSHYLDRRLTDQAAAWLAEAESIARRAGDAFPAELHTPFVFGSAFVQRDAARARFWWDKLQARTPKNLNADYYRAESALHWMEGDMGAANTAWAKCDELTRKLPQAGAYQFDRTCCRLLREAMDGVAPASMPTPLPTQPAAAQSPANWAPAPAPAPEPAYQWSFLRDIPSQPSALAAAPK